MVPDDASDRHAISLQSESMPSILQHAFLQRRRIVLEHLDVGARRLVGLRQGIGIERRTDDRTGVLGDLLDEAGVGEAFWRRGLSMAGRYLSLGLCQLTGPAP